MRVSVVVPTYQRPDLLARCLRALSEQSLPRDDYEILVADDAFEKSGLASERTRELVAVHEAQGMKTQYVPVRGRHGPAAARNAGWRRARADVIAFTDDDTIPDRDWLENGLRVLESCRAPECGEEPDSAPGVLAVCGRTVVPVPDDPTDYELNESGLSRAEFITANCFCRRWALEELNGFDEEFTMAWREDSDLHFRLMKLGGGERAVARAPEAVVVHPVRPAPFAVSLKQVKKVAFNALLFKKHPELYRERIQRRPPLRYYAVVTALSGALVSALSGSGVAWLWLAVWFVLVGQLTGTRLRRTRKTPLHILEMVYTSILLPPLAVYWRLNGAWRFKVLFV